MRPPIIEYPNQKQLAELLTEESGRCVSLWMRTHQSGPETNQNAVRFKNLIRDAIEQAGDQGPVAELKKLAELEHDFEFWQHQASGFALFLCDGFMRAYKLEHEIDDGVHVADHFQIRPLVHAVCTGQRAFVLTVSWKEAHLYQADSHKATELTWNSFPVTMEELVTERDPETQLQYSSHRAGGAPGAAADVAMYHGQGEGEDKIDADRDMYLSRIGHLITEVVYNRHEPLVVLGTDEVVGHLKATTQADVHGHIAASPDGMNESQLHEKIVEGVSGILHESASSTSNRLGTALSNDGGSKEITEIVAAAAKGRVDTLLIGSNEAVIGKFDDATFEATVDPQGDTDLVNESIRRTLLADGTLVRRPDDSGAGNLAAIFRY